MKKDKKDIRGIIVYEIKDDGCLNGTWTNNDVEGVVMNEIAKKVGTDTHVVRGDYIVAFIDFNGDVFKGKLSIDQNGSVYNLKWYIENADLNYEGIGLRFGNNNLVASYWVSD